MLLSQRFDGEDQSVKYLALLKSQVKHGLLMFDNLIQRKPEMLDKAVD